MVHYGHLMLFFPWQNKIEKNPDKRGKPYTAQVEISDIDADAANAKNNHHGDNNKITCFHKVFTALHKRIQAHNQNAAEKQNHNSAHNRHRHAMKHSPEFAHAREQNRRNSRPSHNRRIKALGKGDRSGNFRICRIRGTAQ